MIRTKVDDLVDYLGGRKTALFTDVASALKWDIKSVEKTAQALEKEGILKLQYPIFKKPWMMMLKMPADSEEKERRGELIEKYSITGLEGHIDAEVKIIKTEEENEKFYFIGMGRASTATTAYLKSVEKEVVELSPIKPEKESNEGKDELLQRHGIINSIIMKDLGPDKKSLEALCGILLRNMYGLGEIEILLADGLLEEIVINSAAEPTAVYHKKHGWLRTNIVIPNETEVANYAAQIARKIGKQISLLNPLLDAHLLSGDRVNSTLFPISTKGNTITFRMFARNPWTMTGLLGNDKRTLSYDMAALLWQAVHYEMNVMVGGGTASGKTSMLNSVIALIPPEQRVISIEDTRELALPNNQWNWVPLTTRTPNPEGLGEVTMLDLVVNSLRMRPDRIVMGEIRRKKEAEVLFEAMHTGHSVYATMHADTGSQLLKRLIEPPIEVPASEVDDVHLIAVQYRDRRKNVRKLLEIGEISVGPNNKPEFQRIYLWRPRFDKFELVSKQTRYLEQLNLHTGMTEKEITADQENKKTVLEWMVKNKLENVEAVGKVMYSYYHNEDTVVKAAEKNAAPSKIMS